MILHHVLAGTGPAVLLLHSTATDSRQWKVQIEVLGQDFTVVAPDLRGYGRSPLTSEPFSHVDDITRLMDSLSFEDFAIVASSGGGAIALQVASAVPKRVRAMVLLCAAAQGVEPTAELRSFGEKENALLEGGDVAGATELNVHMWVQPLADEVTGNCSATCSRMRFACSSLPARLCRSAMSRPILPASPARSRSSPEPATSVGFTRSPTNWRPSCPMPPESTCPGLAISPISSGQPKPLDSFETGSGLGDGDLPCMTVNFSGPRTSVTRP